MQKCRVGLPSEVANAARILLNHNTVYKRARLALSEYESGERRVISIVMMVMASIDVVRMIVAMVMPAGQ